MHTITNKAAMYARLASGGFGNTIPQYFSVPDWLASGDSRRYPVWGVRTLTPGGPCRLYCPREEVVATVAAFVPHQPNISVMVGTVATTLLMADVCVTERGLTVYGIDLPAKGADWRRDMPRLGRQRHGLAASGLLRARLNEQSLGDLYDLLDLYPGHVVELTALDRCFGTVPGRNAVIWEVRCDGGQYERSAWGDFDRPTRFDGG